MSQYISLPIGNKHTALNQFPYSKDLDRDAGYNIWYPRREVEWTPDIRSGLLGFFLKSSYPYRKIQEIPFPEPLRSEIRRFFIALDAYLESPNPVIPDKYILFGVTDGPSFNVLLKRIKKKATIIRFNAALDIVPDWYEDTPIFHIKDIGDIFNYNYSIFWKEEDENDYLYSLKDLEFSTKYLEKFKETLLELLPDRESFQMIDPRSILLEQTSSTSLDKSLQNVKNYQAKYQNMSFSEKRGISKRCRIPIGPQNYRDTVILPISDLNTIKLIDLQIMNILDQMPSHIHLRNEKRIERRIKKLFSKYTHFLHRDYTKEGLTKPRILLKIMLECLHKAYPDIDIFGYTSFYDNYTILVDNIEIETKRGHGLGMANSLTTLMQLTVHSLVVKEMTDNELIIGKTDMLALNDDFVAAFTKSNDLEEYYKHERIVINSLGLMREDSKTFISKRCFTIAEIYISNSVIDKKESYHRRTALLALASMNIIEAKALVSSLYSYINEDIRDLYMNEILSYWGYEFFQNECLYPYEVGGWISTNYNGCSLLLKSLEKLPYNTNIYNAYNAVNIRKVIIERSKEIFSPIHKMYANLELPEVLLNVLNIYPSHLIKSKFTKIHEKSDLYLEKYYSKLSRMRQLEFKKCTQITFDDFIWTIIKDNPEKTYYPIDSMVAYYDNDLEPVLKVKDIYFEKDCILRYLDKKYQGTEDPSYFNLIVRNQREIDRNRYRDILRYQNIGIDIPFINNLLIEEYEDILVPKSLKGDFERSYVDPISICYTNTELNPYIGLPILKEEYRSPLIYEKEKIFGKIFPIRFQSLLSYIKNQDLFNYIADQNIDELDNIESALANILDKKEEEKRLLLEQESNKNISNESDKDEDIYFTKSGIKIIPVSLFIKDGSYGYDLIKRADVRTDDPVINAAFDSLNDKIILIQGQSMLFNTGNVIQQHETIEKIRKGMTPLESFLFEHSGMNSFLFGDALESLSDTEGGAIDLFPDDW